jgi:serine/threonine protein kinase
MHPDERVHIGTTLRWIHHTATALHELHFSEIAHQDLRPAHVFVMPNKSAKVGGLGNCHNHKSPAAFATSIRDLTYRSPEVLYGRMPWTIADRFASDMYALGSLAFFLLTGVSMNVELTRALDPMHHWTTWRGDFSEALPYIIEPFDEVIASNADILNWDESGRLIVALRQLCHPDPEQRGHPANRDGAGSRYSLERYVSLFDLLASRMEWQKRKAG